MSGYYPDGVTGNEYAIAGADREWTDERDVYCNNEECEQFEVDTTADVDLASYGSSEWGTWTCKSCNTEQEFEREVEYDDSPYDTIQEANEDW